MRILARHSLPCRDYRHKIAIKAAEKKRKKAREKPNRYAASRKSAKIKKTAKQRINMKRWRTFSKWKPSLLRDANENLWFMERNKLRAKIGKYERGREEECVTLFMEMSGIPVYGMCLTKHRM